jgi:hypothetical protein
MNSTPTRALRRVITVVAMVVIALVTTGAAAFAASLVEY